MSDLIDKQAAIDALETIGYDFSDSGLSEIELEEVCEAVGDVRQDMINIIKRLPSAQQSRLENTIHGKSPEEIYEFIFWLFLVYAMQFTDSRHAIINWLKGESDECPNKQAGGD